MGGGVSGRVTLAWGRVDKVTVVCRGSYSDVVDVGPSGLPVLQELGSGRGSCQIMIEVVVVDAQHQLSKPGLMGLVEHEECWAIRGGSGWMAVRLGDPGRQCVVLVPGSRAKWMGHKSHRPDDGSVSWSMSWSLGCCVVHAVKNGMIHHGRVPTTFDMKPGLVGVTSCCTPAVDYRPAAATV